MVTINLLKLYTLPQNPYQVIHMCITMFQSLSKSSKCLWWSLKTCHMFVGVQYNLYNIDQSFIFVHTFVQIGSF